MKDILFSILMGVAFLLFVYYVVAEIVALAIA
jgi:hypothetical protein